MFLIFGILLVIGGFPLLVWNKAIARKLTHSRHRLDDRILSSVPRETIIIVGALFVVLGIASILLR